MRLLCLLLFLGLATPGCSRFTKTGRMDRAYYKQLAAVKSKHAQQRERLFRQRTEVPAPDAPPVLQPEQNVSMATGSDSQ
jgi:hypothetical protein